MSLQSLPYKQDDIRHFVTFSFSSTDIEKHLQENFPRCNAIIQGYCAAKFPDIIPEGCTEYGLNNHPVIDENGEEVRVEYYECRGKEIVIEGCFTNESPWMIPISISSLHGSQIMEISRDMERSLC